MLEHTKEILLKEQLLKEYNIKSENKEAIDVVKELARTIVALFSKIREKNKAIDKRRLISEASLLQSRCTALRGKLTRFGIRDVKKEEGLCMM